ncbi:MAG: hypothetical protein IPK32_08065 [Verrucomicrobiaceae bacterium]|nr:hypothetical protein [Verrucomicrobiaceae bacterium]
MNTDPSRREFLTLASLGLAGVIPGCTTNQSAQAVSDYKIHIIGDLVPVKFCKAANEASASGLITPLGGSIERFLAKSGGKSVTVVFVGNFVTSKQLHNHSLPTYDPSQQRSGVLQTTITYTAAKAGNFSVKAHQTLNGVPCQTSGFFSGLAAPFFMFDDAYGVPIRFESPAHGCMINNSTGVGSPEISFSSTVGPEVLKLRPAGSKHVVALGRSVNVWNWKLSTRNTNRSDQPVRQFYDTMLSTEIPGQLESYSYRYEVGGDLIESSTGQLASIR